MPPPRWKPGARSRLAQSIELALRVSGGRVMIVPVDGEPLEFSERCAGGRLRQREQAGGTRHALVAGHGDKHLDLAQRELHIEFIDISIRNNLILR